MLHCGMYMQYSDKLHNSVNLLQDIHVCPVFLNLENIVPWMAVWTSAELNTMRGAFPPNSSETFFTVSAHCRISSFPTPVEPVKETAVTSSLLEIASPIAVAD